MTASTRVLRVYDSARTAHLERLAEEEGVHLAYRTSSYDFDDSLADGLSAEQTSRLGIVRLILSGRFGTLELNEPLMLAAWPSSVLYTAAAHVAGVVGRRPRIVSYAIENGSVAEWVSSRLRLPAPAARALVSAVGRFLVSSHDRLAFGTDGARANYRENIRVTARKTPLIATFEPLEPPCVCGIQVKHPHSVVFVGSFEPRKGILQLMAAWDVVAAALPDATLTLAGSGELEGRVRVWAEGAARVELLIAPPRKAIHDVLGRSTTAVLFSQPEIRWREQVGLPIVEALSHGCHIVASEETGIADWLTNHGHLVLSADVGIDRLASVIIDSMRASRTAEDVVRDLPAISGRRSAFEWMTKEFS